MLTTNPDGMEVVDSWEGEFDAAHAPLLVLDRLRDVLDERGFGAGPLAWERIGDGQSNVTYRIGRGASKYVVRRGPRPPHPNSTHDMLREARIQRLLKPAGVPVPEILMVCESSSVLGVPFYVMEWLDGVVITKHAPPRMNSLVARRQTSLSLVSSLVSLHRVDVNVGPLASLGRAEGYLERQITRFANLWDANSTRVLPDVGKVATWLETNRPKTQQSAVVHGDYRLGNLMMHPDVPVSCLAILDWEMATLGDPLADLGYLTATYSDADAQSTPLHLSPATAGPGYLSRAELAAEYSDRTGANLAALPWYETLALWKAAVFCEAIYTRWLKGQRPHDKTFGPNLAAGVPQLLAAARAAGRV
jgi:aminoglycoside phosphotransferase (APT) family kinase protein